MNTFRTPAWQTIAVALALPLFAGLAGCDIDSTTATTSDNSGTIYNFSGLYMHPDSTGTNVYPLVYPTNGPSGKLITSLRLLQYGSVLEAYDSASQTWTGSISDLKSDTATFSLKGRTTAGQAVEIAGTMVYADQESTMDASWIEASYYGSVSAKATVSPANTNSSDTSLSISPTSVTLNSSKSNQVFTASGGSGTYVWTVTSSTLGAVSPSSGSSVTYTSTKVVGTNTVRVTDSLLNTKTATAIYE
jgi:hypothetical protein